MTGQFRNVFVVLVSAALCVLGVAIINSISQRLYENDIIYDEGYYWLIDTLIYFIWFFAVACVASYSMNKKKLSMLLAIGVLVFLSEILLGDVWVNPDIPLWFKLEEYVKAYVPRFFPILAFVLVGFLGSKKALNK